MPYIQLDLEETSGEGLVSKERARTQESRVGQATLTLLHTLTSRGRAGQGGDQARILGSL